MSACSQAVVTCMPPAILHDKHASASCAPVRLQVAASTTAVLAAADPAALRTAPVAQPGRPVGRKPVGPHTAERDKTYHKLQLRKSS